MELKHEKTVTVIEKRPICTSVYCDSCNKHIYTTVRPGMSYNGNRSIVDYYKITTGHNDWGNDSVDSINYQTLCPDCFMDEVVKFKNRSIGRQNTEYIVIDHEWTYDFGEWTQEEENFYE